MNIKPIFLLLIFTLFTSTYCKAQTLQTKNVITKLNTPWEILWGPDNYIWITERGGKVSRINPDNGQQEVLLTITNVIEKGESGLLGMALHPDFANNPWVYLAYTYLYNSTMKEKIVRYAYKNNKLENEEVLLDNITASTNHDGCRLVFGPDGKLYISTGEAGNGTNSQNRASLNGKILRMNADGSIPSDNPFGNSYVWATGSRNAQGLVWANGKLYGSEHGAGTNDEVNIYQSGRNFGWPTVEGFCDRTEEQTFCADSNVVEPLYAWTPTLAVCGIDYYKSGNPITEWSNSLLLTSLKAGKFTILHLDENGEKITKAEDFYSNQFGRLRDVCVSPGGRVFISTSNQDSRGTPGAEDDRILELIAPVSIPGDGHIYRQPKILENPADGNIRITNMKEKTKLEIYDISGKQYFSRIATNTDLEINCAHWPSGMYVLKSSGNSFISSQKILVNLE